MENLSTRALSDQVNRSYDLCLLKVLVCGGGSEQGHCLTKEVGKLLKQILTSMEQKDVDFEIDIMASLLFDYQIDSPIGKQVFKVLKQTMEKHVYRIKFWKWIDAKLLEDYLPKLIQKMNSDEDFFGQNIDSISRILLVLQSLIKCCYKPSDVVNFWEILSLTRQIADCAFKYLKSNFEFASSPTYERSSFDISFYGLIDLSLSKIEASLIDQPDQVETLQNLYDCIFQNRALHSSNLPHASLCHLLHLLISQSNDEHLSYLVLQSILEKVDLAETKFLLHFFSSFLQNCSKSVSLLKLELCAKNPEKLNVDFRSLTKLVIQEAKSCHLIEASMTMYRNWLNHFLSQDVSSEEEKNAITAIVMDTIDFLCANWHHGKSNSIVETTTICIKLLESLYWDKNEVCIFLNQIIDRLFHSRQSQWVYWLYSIIHNTISAEDFAEFFKNRFASDFCLADLIDQFLRYSDETLLDAAFARIKYDVKDFIILRFQILFPCELVLHEVKELSSSQRDCFFNQILPQLVKNKKLVATLLKFLLLATEMDVEYLLKIFELNRKYDLNLVVDVQKRIDSLINDVVLIHFDDQIRLKAISMLLTYRKSTEPASEEDCELLYRLFVTSTNIQSSSGRDQLVRSYEALFQRMKCAIRDKTTGKKYLKYCRRYVKHSFAKLNSVRQYFGSTIVYLNIIQSYIDTFEAHKMQNAHNLDSQLTIATLRSLTSLKLDEDQKALLMSLMMHSFQEIKLLAKKLFVTCVKLQLFKADYEELEEMESGAYSNLKRIQPQEVQLGVIQVRTLVCLKPNESHLLRLFDLLHQSVKSIKSNSMLTVREPCYPYLSAIRAIVCEEHRFDQLATMDIEWVVGECISAFEAVREVVCNDSPEGHLPMDYTEVITDNQMAASEEVAQLYVTSQMLLLNGWMTVKEVVNILTEVSSNLDSELADTIYERVLTFIYDCQLNLVHRGAFEQCSRAFDRLISSVWKRKESTLVKLCRTSCVIKTNQILQEIASFVTGENLTRFQNTSITRRSGGLPFLVQSILACTGIGNHGWFIDSMFGVLSPKKKLHHWQVVHALNIFKFLTCDGRVADSMATKIEPLFKVAIFWFNRRHHLQHLIEADQKYSYSVQNSSSMLIDALITRVFGVKRNKEDTSRKNRMTSLRFFQAYPSMYSVLNEQLKSERGHSLYPSLILLSRLTPSRDKQSFDVGQFLPYIKSLVLNSIDTRIQTLAVRVYCLLNDSFLETFTTLNEELVGPKMSHNCMYGLGLLIYRLVSRYNAAAAPDSEINDTLIKIYGSITEVLDSNSYDSVYRPLVLAHLRIYSLLAKELKHSTRSLQVLEKFLLANPPPTQLAICEDEFNVNLVMDYIIHSITMQSAEGFGKKLQQLISFAQDERRNFCEAKLALWCFLNELLLLASPNLTESCLKRDDDLDTVFADSITQFVYILKAIHQNHLICEEILNAFKSNSFIGGLVQCSLEWNLAQSKWCGEEPTTSLSSVQLDIVSQTMVMLYNARKISIISNVNQFLRLTSRQLFTWLQDDYENAEFNLFQLMQQSLTDQPKDQVDIDLVFDLAYFIGQKSVNLESVQYRQASLTCLGNLLPMVIEMFLSKKKEEVNSMFDTLLYLVNSLLFLLQDNEATIRGDACKVVQSVVEFLKKHSQFEKFNLKILSNISWSHPFATRVTVIVFTKMFELKGLEKDGLNEMLEFVDKYYYEDEESIREEEDELGELFDKSKVDIFADYRMLKEIIILEEFRSVHLSMDISTQLAQVHNKDLLTEAAYRRISQDRLIEGNLGKYIQMTFNNSLM